MCHRAEFSNRSDGIIENFLLRQGTESLQHFFGRMPWSFSIGRSVERSVRRMSVRFHASLKQPRHLLRNVIGRSKVQGVQGKVSYAKTCLQIEIPWVQGVQAQGLLSVVYRSKYLGCNRVSTHKQVTVILGPPPHPLDFWSPLPSLLYPYHIPLVSFSGSG